jgi:chemotaxis signal transduction protein
MINTAAVQENQSIKIDSRAGKYLTFFLDREEYGVEILKVQGHIRPSFRSPQGAAT